MWIKNYVSATFHRQGIFKYKVLIILFTPYSPSRPARPSPCGIFVPLIAVGSLLYVRPPHLKLEMDYIKPQSHRVFILNTKEQRHNVFFGSGRYKEQLKLLYKGHKVFCRKALWRLLSRLLSLYLKKTLSLCVFVLNS